MYDAQAKGSIAYLGVAKEVIKRVKQIQQENN